MKKIILSLIATLALAVGSAQEFYIEPKVNLAAACVTIFNPAVEVGFGNHSAIEYNNVSAYSKTNFMGTGEALILNFNLLSYRYYLLNKEHTGFFVGGDFGRMVYKMQKGIVPFVDDSSRGYDWGDGIVLGVTLGYKFLFKEHFGLEFSASGGWQHSNHEPYNEDGTLEVPMNKSGEWLPYKAGIYFSYRFNASMKNNQPK